MADVTEAVCVDLRARADFGLKKYGHPLGARPATHRERLQFAYEEALDLASYLKWEIMAIDGETEAS
jgi:hypothetical protein